MMNMYTYTYIYMYIYIHIYIPTRADLVEAYKIPSPAKPWMATQRTSGSGRGGQQSAKQTQEADPR